MKNWREEVWFFDTEVLPHDWLFCATDGTAKVSIHNNTEELVQFLQDYSPFLCGYNCKHYDMYIIKAILAGGSPEDVKAVNDAIVVDGQQGWEIDMGWVALPQSFDLMLDLPTMPSLKMIEGSLKMDIRESEVDFGTERPTKEQWASLEEYCWHDVKALMRLYEQRTSYLEGKETVALMGDMDVKWALNMTNAKLTAAFLGAKKVERDDEREYVYPDNLRLDLIPPKVLEFFDRLPNSDIPLDILFGREGVPDEDGKVVISRNPYRSLKVDIAGVPHVVGWGGLHGSRNKYAEVATEDRVILNEDVASFYPSLMIENQYISRNIPDPSIFEDVVKRRLEAKHSGDKKTADALKLVVNTTYGASNNRYNDLYDPLMAHSVCISGQLYLIMLIRMLELGVPTFKLIDSNTDGIMFSIDREWTDKVRAIIKQWEAETRFVMEETEIAAVVKKDVNNYVMREVSGKVKVKGGMVITHDGVSFAGGGSFRNNSLSIVSKAVVLNLLDGVPVEQTIEGCDDIFAFQMIMKAGGSYEKVVHSTLIGDIEVNRTNRIYAGKDQRLGSLYKIKSGPNPRRDKVANCPEHAIVDNSATARIDTIDKTWYIELATERVNQFKKIKQNRRKKMEEDIVVVEDEAVETVVKEKKTRTPKTPVEKGAPGFQEKLFNLADDIAKLAGGFVKDGYNPSQSYEYVRAQQYKAVFREALRKNRLRHKVDDAVCTMDGLAKSDKMVLSLYHGILTIIDIDSDERETYMIWSQGADNLDKGLSKAKTLAIKDFIKLNYLVSDNEDDPEADTKSRPVGGAPKKFIAPSEAKRKAATVVKDTEMADEALVTQVKNAILAIREASGDATYAEKSMGELEKPITASRATVMLTKLEMKGSEYGLEI